MLKVVLVFHIIILRNTAMNKIVFSNYKCFRNETTIEDLNLINLFIGRNNCGKTSALDIIEFVYSDDPVNEIKSASISFEAEITKDIIDACYDNNVFSGWSIYGNEGSDNQKAQVMLGNKYLFSYKNGKQNSSFADFNKIDNHLNDQTRWNRVSQAATRRIDKFTFFKIASERDIKTEESSGQPIVNKKGEGFTRLLNFHLNNEKGIIGIKTEILDAINAIMKGEDFYTDINVLFNESKLTVYLYEKDKRYSLNEMGSGLKTILIVATLLHLGVKTTDNPAFIFEELENNLHPEIQRRLFEYIVNFAIKHNTPVFITSHSHVAINLFYGNEKASVYHIRKDSGNSTIEKINDSLSKTLILKDLGVQASDLFQTNCIIWVEGPSDRKYNKKWLELYDSKLEENAHYSFLYYGGKLLSHFTASEEETNNLINILLTNRNSIIFMDHDEDSEESPLRPTKRRIIEEMNKAELLTLVTKGKEIENYIDCIAINKTLAPQKAFKQIKPYKKFSEYIKPAFANFEQHKIEFANLVVQNMDLNSLHILDLKSQIERMSSLIKKYNHID